MKKTVCALLWGLLAVNLLPAGNGDFTLQVKNDGALQVSFRGQEVINGSFFRRNGEAVFTAGQLKRSAVPAADGSTVYNVWLDSKDHRFRQEAVISADGKRVEFSVQFDYQAGQWTDDTFEYSFKVNKNFMGQKNFTARQGRASAVKEFTGTLPMQLNGMFPQRVRMMALEHPVGGLIFDFDPHGAPAGYDVGSMRGLWDLRGSRDGSGDFEFFIARPIPHFGFNTTAKVVLTAGGMKEYNRYHARKSYAYNDILPAQKLYSFGAAQVGKRYTVMDLKKSDGKGDGWLDPADGRVFTNNEPGAFYSAVGGSRKARFYLGGLEPGFYFITANIGNRCGRQNNTLLKVNGQVLVDNVSVEKNRGTSITRVFKLEKGSAEITLEGDWQLSGLGVQQLMSLYEDFSLERGFWYTEGFEPGVIMSSEEFKTPAQFNIGRCDFTLPELDEPFAPKPLEYAVEMPAQPEKMDWRYNAVIGDMGPANQGSFREFDAPGLVEKRLDEMKKDRINMVIVNGLLSRHTYPAQQGHVQSMIKRMAQAGHERGMKLFDHIDYTLLWNRVAGFRVAAKDAAYLARELSTMLPTTDYCPNQPQRNAAFRKYLLGYILDTNIDGMMIDEVCYPGFDFCGCGVCREEFFRDTAVHYPVNELAGDLPPSRHKASGTELDKLFRTWRAKQVGDWWVDTRRAIQQSRGDFSFFCYTTHYGLTDGWAYNRGGADLLQVGRAVDFLGTEIMSRNVWAASRAVSVLRKCKNMYRLEYGGPIFGLVYSLNSWDVSYYGWAMNNMNAQVTWAAPLHCPAGKSNYYEFGDRNMDLKNAVNYADTAFIFSSQSRNNGILMNYMQESFGTAQVLDAMHVSFDIISDISLTAQRLGNYKLVFAPACGAISDEQVELLKNYVRNGGHLVISGHTGCANALGVARSQWPFADMLGFERNWRGVTVREFAFNGKKNQQPVNRVFGFLPKGNVPAQPSPVEFTVGNKTYAGIYQQKYGKGTVYCLPFAAGQAVFMPEVSAAKKMNFKHDQALEAAFRSLLQLAIDQADAGVWQCSAPDKVHTSLYKIKNSNLLYAHFLNGSGSNFSYGDTIPVGVPEGGFPQLKEDITFELKDRVITRAEAASPDFEGWKELRVEAVKAINGSRITLPKELLKVYTIVKLTAAE